MTEPETHPTFGSGEHPGETRHPPVGDQTVHEPAQEQAAASEAATAAGVTAQEQDPAVTRAARIAARQVERAAAAEVAKVEAATKALAEPLPTPAPSAGTHTVADRGAALLREISRRPSHAGGSSDEPPYPGYGR